MITNHYYPQQSSPKMIMNEPLQGLTHFRGIRKVIGSSHITSPIFNEKDRTKCWIHHVVHASCKLPAMSPATSGYVTCPALPTYGAPNHLEFRAFRPGNHQNITGSVVQKIGSLRDLEHNSANDFLTMHPGSITHRRTGRKAAGVANAPR